MQAPALTRINTVASALLGAEHSGQLEGRSYVRPLGHQALGQTPPEAALALRMLRFMGKG